MNGIVFWTLEAWQRSDTACSKKTSDLESISEKRSHMIEKLLDDVEDVTDEADCGKGSTWREGGFF